MNVKAKRQAWILYQLSISHAAQTHRSQRELKIIIFRQLNTQKNSSANAGVVTITLVTITLVTITSVF